MTMSRIEAQCPVCADSETSMIHSRNRTGIQH